MKRFIDSLAYFYMVGCTSGIETDYKQVMHAKREIPASNCPSFVENIFYSSGGTTDAIDEDERSSFQVMTDVLDEKARKYESPKQQRKWPESRFHKRMRLGIHDGEWCRVDTNGEFEHNGCRFKVDVSAEQYKPVETDLGMLYDMDRILVADDGFYDMNYDNVIAHIV